MSNAGTALNEATKLIKNICVTFLTRGPWVLSSQLTNITFNGTNIYHILLGSSNRNQYKVRLSKLHEFLIQNYIH